MTNEEFIQYAKEHIREYLPSDYKNADVHISTVVRPNDETYTGLCLIRRGNKAGPRIRLEEYAKDLRTGTSLEHVMANIAEEITSYKPPSSSPLADGLDMKDFEALRPYLTTKLCDARDSMQYLSDKPWTPVGDTWGLLYRLKLVQENDSIGSAPITYEIMELWDGIDLPVLHRAAVDNESSKDPAWMATAHTLIVGKTATVPNVLEQGPLRNIRPTDAFFLSNKSHFNGACVTGWDGVLDRVGDVLGRDFYVVPASIHEVMIVPAFPSTDPMTLEEHVRFTNRNPQVVSPDDILSNRVQYYNRRRQKLSTPERKFRR